MDNENSVSTSTEGAVTEQSVNQSQSEGNLNDGLIRDITAEEEFYNFTDGLKLSRKQAEEINKWANGKATEAISKHKNNVQLERESTLKKLEEEWGDKHKIRLTNAIKASEKISSIVPEFKEFLESTGAGNDYRLIKTMEKLSDFINEDYITTNSMKVESKTDYYGDMPLITFDSMKKY